MELNIRMAVLGALTMLTLFGLIKLWQRSREQHRRIERLAVELKTTRRELALAKLDERAWDVDTLKDLALGLDLDLWALREQVRRQRAEAWADDVEYWRWRTLVSADLEFLRDKPARLRQEIVGLRRQLDDLQARTTNSGGVAHAHHRLDALGLAVVHLKTVTEAELQELQELKKAWGDAPLLPLVPGQKLAAAYTQQIEEAVEEAEKAGIPAESFVQAVTLLVSSSGGE